MTDIRKTIETTKDWSELIDILADVGKKDLRKVRPLLPDLINHNSWVVRAEVLDLIGDFKIKSMARLVKQRLKDRNAIVRSYALSAHYDLLGKKALTQIRKCSRAENVGLRVSALALLYVETKSAKVLDRIRRIVTRQNCNYHHQGSIVNHFEYYLDINEFPEVVNLYNDILKVIPPTRGVAKHITDILRRRNL